MFLLIVLSPMGKDKTKLLDNREFRAFDFDCVTRPNSPSFPVFLVAIDTLDNSRYTHSTYEQIRLLGSGTIKVEYVGLV